MRLLFHNVLSETQAAAGFYIGDLNRKFCRQKSSPTTRNEPPKRTELPVNSPEPLLFGIESMREEEWLRVENEVEALPQTLRDAIRDLCVMNEPIPSALYSDTRDFLDRVARTYGSEWARHQVRELKFFHRRPSSPAPSKKSDDDIYSAVLEEMLSILRPDLKSKELSDARNKFFALRDREEYREEKLATVKKYRAGRPKSL